ncbi:hypothetical protein AVEN_47865-1 [Araneus ventricosus]|uniref:Uncharacterized protein n=1 Tax=Araneus ventricosus TaxID=182803 RepID=A0A4Y2UNT1_ARAVE|nr:hypothetical protein AVEN_47865-1 [Araneus ventricosus]
MVCSSLSVGCCRWRCDRLSKSRVRPLVLFLCGRSEAPYPAHSVFPAMDEFMQSLYLHKRWYCAAIYIPLGELEVSHFYQRRNFRDVWDFVFLCLGLDFAKLCTRKQVIFGAHGPRRGPNPR